MAQTFIIAEANERFVQQFHGQTFSFKEALQHAQAFANRAGRSVFVWNVESPEANRFPVREVRPNIDYGAATLGPFPLRAGHHFELLVNQAYRPARILAILDEQALAEYEMPAGTSALNILPVQAFSGQSGEQVAWYMGRSAVSYFRLPLRWLQVLADNEVYWLGQPQHQVPPKDVRRTTDGRVWRPSLEVPQPASLLQERLAKKKGGGNVEAK